jgi:3-hydroxy-9,10-secoandrosta-1,3,5(10)-triene-9,17-dione monooxygenase
MASFTEDYLTPEALEVIERARAMAPRLAERARAAEDAGLVPSETIAEMQEAGFFKVLQPKRWGGYEMDPRVFYSVQMALAEGCMATAWIYGVVGVHNWQLPLFPEQAQIDVWGEDPMTLTASTYMPVGKAEAVEGGLQVQRPLELEQRCGALQMDLVGRFVAQEGRLGRDRALHLFAAQGRLRDCEKL